MAFSFALVRQSVFNARLHIRVRLLDQRPKRGRVNGCSGPQLQMAHKLARALQQARRVPQCCSLKEPHIHMRCEYGDVGEGHIAQARIRTAVVQDFPHLVSARSHHVKPLARDGSESAVMLVQPRIDGRIALDGAIESQQLAFYRFSHAVVRVSRLLQGATLSSYSMGSPKPSISTPIWRRASSAIKRRCALKVMMCAKTPP